MPTAPLLDLPHSTQGIRKEKERNKVLRGLLDLVQWESAQVSSRQTTLAETNIGLWGANVDPRVVGLGREGVNRL